MPEAGRPPTAASPRGWSADSSAPTTRASTTPTGPSRGDRTPPSADTGTFRTLTGDGPSERRVITSAATSRTAPPFRDSDGRRRPTPYESGLAAVARHEVHIERVWPMRSPSTGTLEESSSAYFQSDRRGTPPARIMPVGGLRMSQAFPHEPVMADGGGRACSPRCLPGLIVDATLGGGGHAAALLAAHPGIGMLGIDRDPAAVAAAADALAPFGGRADGPPGRASTRWPAWSADTQAALGTPLEQRGLSGALFDLGVSSPQLDVAERGFSYRRDAVLDMRMDPTSGRTAADVVNDYEEDELVELFTDNGEGRFARRIARAIVAARPLTTTGQLADVVRAAIPAATRRTGGHPARRVFQAIRIAVNEELDQLERALDDALALLRPGGRCVVISYHSGEDRLVKTTFHRAATDDCQCPPGLPCVCGADPQFRLVTRGARRPSEEEVARNRRAEAARLRVIERLPAAVDRLPTARWPDGTAGHRHGASRPGAAGPPSGTVGPAPATAAAVRARPPPADRHPGRPAVHHVALGPAHRGEPAGRGGGGRLRHPGPGPAVHDPAALVAAEATQKSAAGGGGREGRPAGGGEPGQEPGTGGRHPGGLPAPGPAGRPPSAAADRGLERPRLDLVDPPTRQRHTADGAGFQAGPSVVIPVVPVGIGDALHDHADHGAGHHGDVHALHLAVRRVHERPGPAVSPSILLGRRSRAMRLALVVIFWPWWSSWSTCRSSPTTTTPPCRPRS